MGKKRKAGLIQWRKMGGGTLRFNNRIIKPGQVFSASVDDIPKAFRDTVVPIDPVKAVKKEKPVEDAKGNDFSLSERGEGFWDVIDSKGKAKNEEALSKDEAEKLLAELLKSDD